jgi:DNA-binding CsgD family transcriptional regulator
MLAHLEDRDLELHLPVAADLMSAAAAGMPGVPEAARDLPRLIGELAGVAAAIGSREFYAVALAALGRLLGCERQLAMRYAQFAKPQFLVNHSLSAEAEALYTQKLYRIDPLLGLVRTQVVERVLTTIDMRGEENGPIYFEDLYRSAQIYDELVVLLPAAGGVWVALCLDVNDRQFRADEVAFVRLVYPLIDSLHQRHISSCLSGHRGGYLNDSQLAVMVLDSQGGACFRNGIWSGKVTAAEEALICAASANTAAGVQSLNEQDVVHWERLEAGNALAPGGRIFVVEGRSPGYLGIDTLFSQLAADYELTPRECEIIGLSLRGLSTAAIAKCLDIGAGTVRNHKHRLYAKLDVTSEREIASLIFGKIFTGSRN